MGWGELSKSSLSLHRVMGPYQLEGFLPFPIRPKITSDKVMVAINLQALPGPALQHGL